MTAVIVPFSDRAGSRRWWRRSRENDFVQVADLKHRSRLPATRRQSASMPPSEAAREDEQEHQQDDAEHERPVLGVGDDLLPLSRISTAAPTVGPQKLSMPPRMRHDQHLGRLGPVGVVGKDAALVDAEEAAGEAREAAGDR